LLYIFFGPDDFSLRGRLKELKKEWDDDESLATNTSLFEGKRLTLGELISASNALPFLGPKRLVIVEGLLTRFESKGTQRRSNSDWQEWRTLADHVEEMPSTTELVLVDGKIG